MPDSNAPFPYATHLDVKFPALDVVDADRLIRENTHRWYNQTLCGVNDSVVRLGVIEGEYHWHKHDDLDEFFWVVERSSTTLAVQLAEQVLMMLRSVGLSASIGVAEWDGQTIQTCEQIELAAEQQMQRAKRDGRGCVRSGTGLPSRGQTSEAVPLEVKAERAERNAA